MLFINLSPLNSNYVMKLDVKYKTVNRIITGTIVKKVRHRDLSQAPGCKVDQ